MKIEIIENATGDAVDTLEYKNVSNRKAEHLESAILDRIDTDNYHTNAVWPENEKKESK